MGVNKPPRTCLKVNNYPLKIEKYVGIKYTKSRYPGSFLINLIKFF